MHMGRHSEQNTHRSSSPCRQLRHSHSCQTRGSRRRRSRGGCTAWPRLRGRHCCSRCRSSNHCSCTSLCQRHRPSRRRCPCTGWRLRRGTLARSSRCSSQDCTCSFRCPSHHRSKCRGWRTPVVNVRAGARAAHPKQRVPGASPVLAVCARRPTHFLPKQSIGGGLGEDAALR